MSLPIFGVDDVVYHCEFNFRFPDDLGCLTSFHELIEHAIPYFCEASIQVFCLCLNCVLLFSCKCSVLHSGCKYRDTVLRIYSQVCAFLSLLRVSFDKQFLI